ncbi:MULTISPECIES: hypothetical protein [unclassified Treponema]|uniref:hypothetical protein n=1 Tax=unclassified Treponema TaxID=2638727 RepID=UPI0020A5F7EA|nr:MULTISPECIES: hypothetical protein [unclassified Treponema]UTC67986.1 hypothetical protein E4O06_04895 [Treponema sp. OMZ 789]UTC70709.1 hypothetical protein E4O01_05040 [Treponema sp. OMZ 790]UTC73430.1 hypothetical protein E4O02_05130 [Treponema sp. OMZ 791]
MDSKEKPHPKYKQFTIRFLDRSIRFLSASVFVLILFYILSSSQDFLDSSLFIILNVLMSLCILLIIFTFAAISVKTFFMIRYKETVRIAGLIADVFLFIISIGLAVLFSFLVVVAHGNV